MAERHDQFRPKPEEIFHLILKTREFVVFIDKNLDVDWYVERERKTLGPKAHKDQNEVLNLAARIECTPSSHQPADIRLDFKRMIGEAIARSLENDNENAKRMLSDAEQYINERNAEKSRYWFLVASGYSTLLVLALGALAWITRMFLMDLLGEEGIFLIVASCAGGLGALLSVIMRLGKIKANPASGRHLHYLEGAFRIIAGCISASIVALSVKLGIFLPLFEKVQNLHLAMILAGLVAGASERLAPSIIGKLETKMETTHSEANSTKVAVNTTK